MSAHPRVLIFSLAYFPFIGGAEVAVREITARLFDYKFEIITANLDGKQNKLEKLNNVLVRRVGRRKYFFPFSAYRLAAKLHEQRPYDLVWAIMANQAGMAGALFKRRFPAVPFLLTLQEGDDVTGLAYRLRLLFPRLFRVFQRADYIQAISNYLGAWARYMSAKCPIYVIPNGVNLEKFKVTSYKLQVTSSKSKIVITTSRLVQKNGVDTLIKAMRFLPDNVRLQILGTGSEEMSLRQLMSRHRLDNRVEFLGQVPPDEIPNYLARADVFARPARSEGLGNSFLEAMAVGVPVVGTAVGGIPDFLFDPQGETLKPAKVSPLDQVQTGWLCEVDNPRNLAGKIKFILDPINIIQVRRVIDSAQKMVREKYDWSKITANMKDIFDKLLTD